MLPKVAAKEAEVEHFWQWFAAHEEELFRLTLESPNTQSWMDAIHEQLKIIDLHLCCEFDLDSGPQRTLFLSAGGIEEAFPWVESLYAKAPQFDRWDIVKFKQRKSKTGALVIKEQKFSDEIVFFRLFDDEEKIGIHLFFENFDPAHFSTFGQVGFIFLDSLLGEVDVATKVGEIDFLSLEKGNTNELCPVKELPEAFDQWYQKKQVAKRNFQTLRAA